MHKTLRQLLACALAIVVPSATAGQVSPPKRSKRLSVAARSAPDSLVGFQGSRLDGVRTTLTISQQFGGTGGPLQVEVTYLRLPARGRTPRAPIVFLMGGPGIPASVIGRIPPYWSFFDRLRGVADVILLDQRGTGLSQPALDCGGAGPPSSDFLASMQALTDALVKAFTPCVAGWRARGVPAEAFSVAEVAADIEEIRRQLRVPRVALLGFSYGTRVALEYARRFPAHVDQLVLQGTLGIDHGVRLPSRLDSLLDRVSVTVARDSVGRALTPDFRKALGDLFADFDRSPAQVMLTQGSDTLSITVSREGLQSLIQARLGDARLPALINSLEHGDTRVLTTFVGGLFRDLAAGGGSMFGRAVYCSAPGRATRLELARRQAAGSRLGDVFDNVPTSPEFCRRIGIEPGASGPPPPRPIRASALFITGTLDDRTPLGNAEETRRYFTTSHLVVVENGGHELLPVDTVQAIVARFFATGTAGTNHIELPTPRYSTIEQALQPPRRGP